MARRNWDLTTVAYRNDFERAWYKLDSVLGGGLGGILANPADHAERMAVIAGGDSAPDALTVRNNNRAYYGAGVQSVLGISTTTGPARHQIELGVRYHQDEEDRLQEDDAYQMVGGRMILTRQGARGSQANRISGATAVAGFASDTISRGRWTVAPGLRYETIDLERIDYAGSDPGRAGSSAVRTTTVGAVIPGVGLNYVASPDVTLLGGVHRGFAPPGPGVAEGTDVERSVNYELGARVRRGGVRTELVGFVNDYANLLGRDTLASGGTGEGELFNGGSALIYGLEASAAWTPADAAGNRISFPVRVSYTFTQAEFRNAFESQFGPWGSVQVGDELPYVARHHLYASVDADRGSWRTRLEGHYTGRMRTTAGQGAYVAASATDSYVVLTLSGEYELRDGASLVASIQNLTDSTYISGRHPAGARPGLPRLLQVGLKFALGR
jgi:Fe(3+) dicitrate transport protein